MSRLAPSGSGAAAVHDRVLAVYDVAGARVSEQKLDKRAVSVARFGDEWLVLMERQKHLARVTPCEPHGTISQRSGSVEGASATPFAAGRKAIHAFGVGRDDAVAVVRDEGIELWSRDGERRWAVVHAPLREVVLARDHVVALGEGGALHFFSREKGEALGALRFASPDPVVSFRLAHVDAGVIVIALGEWLVWIDATIRKTVRRVRARAKVVELAADPDHVVVAIEGGAVQAFRAATGEPRASFASFASSDACDAGVVALALGPDALYAMTGGEPEEVRVSERRALDAHAAAASPVCAIAARGKLAAVGDRAGHVRVVESSGDVALREVAAVACGEGLAGLFIGKDGTLTVAGSRVVVRVSSPYQRPSRPLALRVAPTAFVADDAYAFAGTQAGAVDVYDLEAGRPLTAYTLSDDRITALVRLAGAMLVVGTGALDGRVFIVDVVDAKVVHRLSPHDEAFGITCLASDARGRIVASGSDEGSIALLDPQKGRVLAKIRVSETPTSIAFEPSGRRLACVFADGTAALVSFANKEVTVADLGLRGAAYVAWGDALVLGFKDGHVESGDRHMPPIDRPAVAQS